MQPPQNRDPRFYALRRVALERQTTPSNWRNFARVLEPITSMSRTLTLAAVLIVAVAVLGAYGFGSPGSTKMRPNGLYLTKNAPENIGKTELAAFSAGCFWGVEDQFRHQKGVVATAVGFSGGHVPHPSYRRVCEGDTGHAESVMVEYDPKLVSYSQLLDLFWSIHDPTTPNQQGPDIGEQYRSIIFYHTPAQMREAYASKRKLEKSGELKDPIVTEILPAKPFYKAEDYHQQYVEKGGVAFCNVRKKK